MTTDSFDTFLAFFRQLPSARFDEDDGVWRVPKADFKQVVDDIEKPHTTPPLADGGDS
jgi:preprotein translocase subunit SecA